jgi:hypothetical protein
MLDRIPAIQHEVKPDQIDLLTPLRTEHQAQPAHELGAISFAQAVRRLTPTGETPAG